MSVWRMMLDGVSVAKGRGRIVKLGAHMGIKTPEKTRRFEDIVRQTAIREWGRAILLPEVPVTIDIYFARPIPVSWSKKKREDARTGKVLPTGKPDLDNLTKAITDGLNGVVYTDDSAIVELNVRKGYAEVPRCFIEMVWHEVQP